MTIALVGQGTPASGGSSVALSSVTGSVGDKLVMRVVSYGATNAQPTHNGTGWTLLFSETGSSAIAFGVDAGRRRVSVWEKTATATTADSVTVSISEGSNTFGVLGAISRFSKTLGTWKTTKVAGASSATANTSHSHNFTGLDGATAGDWFLWAYGGVPDTATMTPNAPTMTGLSFNARTSTTLASTTGNDARFFQSQQSIASGTGSGNLTQSYTLSASGYGSVVGLIIGEANAGPATGSATGSWSFTGAAAGPTPPLFTEGFEGGADEADITNANTAFSTITKDTSGSIKFDTAYAVTGTRSGRASTTVDLDLALMEGQFTSSNVVCLRAYFRPDRHLEPNVENESNIAEFRTTANNIRAMLEYQDPGSIGIKNGNILVASTTQSVPVNAWSRLEWKVDTNAGQQWLRIFYGANLHSTTPNEEITGTYDNGVGISEFWIGQVRKTFPLVNWWDAVEIRTDWVGPVSNPNSQIPSGSAIGSTNYAATALGSAPRKGVAGATISRAQDAANNDLSNGQSTSVTLARTPTVGNTLFMVVRENDGAATDTVTLPSGFSHVTGSPWSPVAGRQIVVARKKVTAAGDPTTYTVTTSAPANRSVYLVEVSGIADAAPAVAVGSSSETSVTSKTLTSTGTLPRTPMYALAIADQSAANGGAISVTSPFTLRRASEFTLKMVADTIAETTDALAPTFTWTTARSSMGFTTAFDQASSTTFTGSAVGKETPKGSATGNFVFTGSASGKRPPKGSGNGTFTFTGSASGSTPAVVPRTGSASGTFSFTGASAGKRTPKSTATGTFQFSGISSGKKTPKGSASGSFAFTGFASADQYEGDAAGTTTFTGVAVGRRVPKASAAGSFAYSGFASADNYEGDASGTFTFTGSATGKRVPKASGSGTFTFAGAGSGKRAPKGSATGTFSFTAAGSGKRTPKSTASGTTTFSGTGIGDVPANAGVASGVFTFSGGGSGKRVPKASAISTTVYSSTAVGDVPPNRGTAAGTISTTGTASGKRAPKASANGGLNYVGTAVGRSVPKGAGSGELHWTGISSASTLASGTAVGAVVWETTAIGETEFSGSTASNTNWSGTATGRTQHRGTASGSTAWTTTATGQEVPKGSATSTTTWSGSASGKRTPKASASGTLSWVGSGSASVPSGGEALGSIGWVGAAEGVKEASGSGSGTLAWAGEGVGARAPEGAADGSATWSGVAVGVAIEDSNGSAFGYVAWASAASGITDREGSAAGSSTWSGSATPQVEPFEGSASGSSTWSGSAVGKEVPKGSASGSLGWNGSSAGGSIPTGSASGSITWATNQPAGFKIPKASTTSVTVWIATAQGYKIPLGSASGLTALLGAAVGGREASGQASGSTTWESAAVGAASGVVGMLSVWRFGQLVPVVAVSLWTGEEEIPLHEIHQSA